MNQFPLAPSAATDPAESVSFSATTNPSTHISPSASAATSDPLPADDRARLASLFSSVAQSSSTASHASCWSALWDDGTFLPFDRSAPNPALADLLVGHDVPADAPKPLLPAPIDPVSGRRRVAFVPGCGKGYDVLLLASAGYDAWGLEVAPNAVKAAEEWKRSEQSAGWKGYPLLVGEDVGRGEARFVEGDFFGGEGGGGWRETVGGKVDVIYDYTFLCALPPQLRPKWAKTMTTVLAPAGTLVCLEFPTYKDPHTGGPPWALYPEVYIGLFANPGQEVAYDEKTGRMKLDGLERVEKGKTVERVAHWQPKRTHKIGEGTDWIGIWQWPRSTSL